MSEASIRFERQVDGASCVNVAEVAAALFEECCGAEVCPGVVDVYPAPVPASVVTMLNPVFESDAHGYDTRDYTKVDARLGTSDDLRAVVDAFHAAGIRVLFDGVFNHVGRGFWAFRDVLDKRGDSPYANWFNIDWNGNSAYGDGFGYETCRS